MAAIEVSVALDDLAWPAAKVGEALFYLAQQSGLLAVAALLPSFSPADEATLDQWLESSAHRLGVEIEPIHATYREAALFVQRAGPALLRLPTPPQQVEGTRPLRFLALLRGSRHWVYLLAPDHSVQRVHRQVVEEALWSDLVAPHLARLEPLLAQANVPPWRQAATQRVILGELIDATAQRGGWMLRLPPNASWRRQVQQARLWRMVALLVGSYSIQLLLTLGAWWLIGSAALRGEFTRSGLWAWLLLLLTTIPFQLLTAWMQRQLALNIGELFKVRLLDGALHLRPEAIRRQGAGQFLGRVLAADLVEQLALAGGFVTVLAVLQLLMAVAILATGTGGWVPALLLVGWTLLLVALGWRYGRLNGDYTAAHRAMTNDLVERMVGHRTRLAQEAPSRWHDEEDMTLAHYARLQLRTDQAENHLAYLPRGWLLVGLAGFVYTLLLLRPTSAQLAISLGGILLAYQALASMIAGMKSLSDVQMAWREVAEMVAPNVQETSGDSVALTGRLTATKMPTIDEGVAPPTLLTAQGLMFSYTERTTPVLQNCNLHIAHGARMLLTGPSGGGKSTLAALLGGLRTPHAGQLILGGQTQQMLGLAAWRRRVVVVPQFHENYVLTGTLAFNLLLGRRWPPMPSDLLAAEAVCRELGLGDLLDRMPAGLQQIVGESGWRLSHGERSRLYIARALLQHADLLILDESFGALDPAALQTALASVRRRAPTLLVIAHP